MNYYVATNGNDLAAGTYARPWKTLKKAASTVNAGDTAFIKGGVYKEQLSLVKGGSPNALVSFKGIEGEAVIDATGLALGDSVAGSVQGALHIENLGYISCENLVVKGSSCFGVSVYGECNRIDLKHLRVQDCQSSGIHAASIWNNGAIRPTNILIERCDVFNTNYNGDQEAVSLRNVDGFEITDNKVHDVQGNRPYPWIRQNGITGGGCTNGRVRYNEVFNAMDGIYFGGLNYDADNIEISNNTVHNNLGCGITLGSEGSPSPNILNINIHNNLIYFNRFGFLADYYPIGSTFISNFVLENNTFYLNDLNDNIPTFEIKAAQPYEYNGKINYVNCVVRKNIVVGRYTATGLMIYGDYAQGGITVDSNCFYDAAGYNPENKYGTNYIQEDPLFIKPPENFTLAANSPAKGMGVYSTAAGSNLKALLVPAAIIFVALAGKKSSIGRIER